MKTCAGCLYYRAPNATEGGICRRYPPVPVVVDREPAGFGIESAWAAVDADDVCGEWTPAGSLTSY